jgi:hypothetical protein
MYPSGAWRGYWEQQGWGRQSMDPLILHFHDGAISGEGRDVIGAFSFHGSYDDRGNVTLTKQYVGRHSVLYQGSYDGEGTIFGRWSIAPYWSGPFALSPVTGQELAEEPIYELKPNPSVQPAGEPSWRS